MAKGECDPPFARHFALCTTTVLADVQAVSKVTKAICELGWRQVYGPFLRWVCDAIAPLYEKLAFT